LLQCRRRLKLALSLAAVKQALYAVKQSNPIDTR